MYGTEIGLPAAGVTGGGLLFGALHASSMILAAFAVLMLLVMLYLLGRTLLRTRADQRP